MGLFLAHIVVSCKNTCMYQKTTGHEKTHYSYRPESLALGMHTNKCALEHGLGYGSCAHVSLYEHKSSEEWKTWDMCSMTTILQGQNGCCAT